MVVLARPRDESEQEVCLEEDDATEVFLERPYVELLGHSADSSSLQRSLSARVRRRERVGRPEKNLRTIHDRDQDEAEMCLISHRRDLRSSLALFSGVFPCL